MRLFRRYALRRPISVLCIVMLVSPMGGVAFAQSGTTEVAVVSFRNTSKMPDETFSTMATDAIALELMRSGKFGVSTSEALKREMEELGLVSERDKSVRAVLTPSMMQRLGQNMGVGSVVSGELLAVKVNEEKRKAEVRIAVRMLDVASGEWINGAIATGVSHPRIGHSNDRDVDWIIEAINDAARQSVETMVNYIIPEATVLATMGTSQVLLNQGSQQGLDAGMEMIVLRLGETGQDEVVGRIKVSKVTDTDATAAISKAPRGIMPGDRVRAVYQLPSDTTGSKAESPRSETKKRVSSGRNLLWGLLLLVGAAALFKPGSSSSESLPPGVAAAGSSGDIPASGEGGIFIGWNDREPIHQTNLVEYHVWRDGTSGGAPVLALSPSQAMAISNVLGSFDHMAVDYTGARDITYQSPDADHSELTSTEVEGVTGIVPGKTHTYWVSCVYRRSNPGSSDGSGVTYWETTPQQMGKATYLTRPVLTSPGSVGGSDETDLTSLTFEWEGSKGANLYVIEVSTSPNFERDATYIHLVNRTTSADGTPITEEVTDLSTASELQSVGSSGLLYWRVGARNTSDTPGPYPAGPTPQKDGAKNTRYIYSSPNEVFSFKMVGGGGPPPPPF